MIYHQTNNSRSMSPQYRIFPSAVSFSCFHIIQFVWMDKAVSQHIICNVYMHIPNNTRHADGNICLHKLFTIFLKRNKANGPTSKRVFRRDRNCPQFARYQQYNCTAAMTDQTLVFPDRNERCKDAQLILLTFRREGTHSRDSGDTCHELQSSVRPIHRLKIRSFSPWWTHNGWIWYAKCQLKSEILHQFEVNKVFQLHREKSARRCFAVDFVQPRTEFVFPLRCHRFWLAHARHVTSKMAPKLVRALCAPWRLFSAAGSEDRRVSDELPWTLRQAVEKLRLFWGNLEGRTKVTHVFRPWSDRLSQQYVCALISLYAHEVSRSSTSASTVVYACLHLQ